MSSAAAAFDADVIARVVETVGTSVVRIEARSRWGASGVVWGDGLVVTASHAIERDEDIKVAGADGVEHAATLVGRDPSTDLALLKVEGASFTRPAWAELDEAKTRVGTLVTALARPGKTVRATLGIVSTLGEGFRSGHGAKVDRYLETDADFRRGFSGGALVDTQGRVLGMTTAGLVRGANMTLPTSTVARVVNELAAHGRVQRGYLGVGVYPARLSLAKEKELGQRAGLAVVTLEPDGAAEKAGFIVGDVLVNIDGQPVSHPAELTALLAEKGIVKLTAKVLRGGEAKQIEVTPAVRQR